MLSFSAEDVLKALQVSWNAALGLWQKLFEGRPALALVDDEQLPPWLQTIQGIYTLQTVEPARPGVSSALDSLGDRCRALFRTTQERNQPRVLGNSSDAEPLPLWLQMVQDPSLRA
jgi:hypothetical protein